MRIHDGGSRVTPTAPRRSEGAAERRPLRRPDEDVYERAPSRPGRTSSTGPAGPSSPDSRDAARERIRDEATRAALPPNLYGLPLEDRADILAAAAREGDRAVAVFDRLYREEMEAISPLERQGLPPEDVLELERAALGRAEESCRIVLAAERISERCRTTGCFGPNQLTPNELQTLFAAAEIETGVPAELLKAIAYGEGLGNAYPDGTPRHFIEPGLNPGLEGRADWARQLLGVDMPVALGDDRELGSQTYGIGIMQLTASIPGIEGALAGENGSRVTLVGGGSPGSWWTGGTVEMDVNRAIRDPYYNILVGAELIRHKIAIYTDSNRPGGPIPWMPANPQTPMDWAIVGSTYQTMGGYGPGGGATLRIHSRMTEPSADAYPFVSAEPDLSRLAYPPQGPSEAASGRPRAD
jgi:hypothetical protein